MSVGNAIRFSQWASIDQTEKFTSVMPLSGYLMHWPEDAVFATYLESDAEATALGRTVLTALDKSRFVEPAKDREFFRMTRALAAGKRWHDEFMSRFGYKTKRQAYKNMRYCLVKRSEGTITIKPHRRDKKPELWWDLPPEATVAIPATDDAGILGAAAKLALSRCV
jgi:hypothetical protein